MRFIPFRAIASGCRTVCSETCSATITCAHHVHEHRDMLAVTHNLTHDNYPNCLWWVKLLHGPQNCFRHGPWHRYPPSLTVSREYVLLASVNFIPGSSQLLAPWAPYWWWNLNIFVPSGATFQYFQFFLKNYILSVFIHSFFSYPTWPKCVRKKWLSQTTSNISFYYQHYFYLSGPYFYNISILDRFGMF